MWERECEILSQLKGDQLGSLWRLREKFWRKIRGGRVGSLEIEGRKLVGKILDDSELLFLL
jgi:hypothetical protein